MSSLTGTFVGCLAWTGLSAGTALSLGGCHYTEEQKWAVCCALCNIKDEAPSESARATIIEWQGLTWFDGHGNASDSSDSGDTNKKRRTNLEIVNFLADNPGGQASDYF